MGKVKNIVIVVLVIVVLVLGGMLIYSNVNSNNDNDVNINNENNDGNESVNNNDECNTNNYGDIKQLYPTLLEVSTTECSQYVSQEELDAYEIWLLNGTTYDPEKDKKYKNVPDKVKHAIEYFDLVGMPNATGGDYDRYTATSELKEGSNAFLADNLNLRYFNEAWSEGVEGNGIGEKIKYEYIFMPHYGNYMDLEKSMDEMSMKELAQRQYNNLQHTNYSDYLYDEIDNCYFLTSEIIIENGYCKTKELWEKNGRVKILKLTFEDGEEYILNLEDTMKPQSFKLEHKTNGIRNPLEATFEIVDVYEGTTYQDTCITTLELKCGCYGILEPGI